MIVINNELPETQGTVDVFCPADEYIGTVERFSALLDLRKQVKDKGVDGYYIRYRDANGVEHTIDITANGKLSHRPRGMFDVVDKLLTQLI